MQQHPMVKAFVKAFRKAGGKEWASRFNPFQLDQVFRFGYRTFRFRVMSVSTVNSWDADRIPAGAGKYDIVMMPDVSNALGDWLACDSEAKAEFERFEAVIRATFAVYD